MMKNYILIACLSFASCTIPSKEKRNIIEPDSTATYNIGMSIQKELNIRIPEGKYSFYHNTTLYLGRYLFGVNQNKPNIIDIYDITEEKFVDEIVVNENLINDRISGIYVQSLDSIYFCQNSPNAIYLIDSHGVVIDSWDKDDLLIKVKDHDVLSKYKNNFVTFLHQFNPIVHDNRYLYIGIDPQSMYKAIPKLERVGIYDLKNRRWSNFISRYSDLDSNVKGLEYTYDLEQPYILKSDKYIIISYPMEHYIFVYDLQTNEYIKKVPAYSRDVRSFPYPQKPQLMESCQKSWNFRIQTPFYGNLYYHKDSKLYSRVVYHPQGLIDEQGYINNGTNRSASVVILDENLHIVGEVKFDNGSLGVNTYLPTNSGLLIAEQLNTDTIAKYLNYNKVIQFNL